MPKQFCGRCKAKYLQPQRPVGRFYGREKRCGRSALEGEITGHGLTILCKFAGEKPGTLPADQSFLDQQ